MAQWTGVHEGLIELRNMQLRREVENLREIVAMMGRITTALHQADMIPDEHI